jgi:abortive infection bacteriophage resistance protein
MKFTKKPTSVDEQIQLLESRGMTVPDRRNAAHYLQFISYFRLSGYFFHFQVKDGTANGETFKPGISFDKIIRIYVFDRELRLLVMDAVLTTRS